MQAIPQTQKMSVAEKIGYGMGDGGTNIIFGAMTLFLAYFYTDVYGLEPATVGIIMLSVRCIDAFTDILMGAIADRTKSKYGRFRPWLLWAVGPFALFSILMFTTPDWSYNAKVAYAFFTYLLQSLANTAIGVPYCSLGGVITNEPHDRVSCQSYRFVCAGIAQLILSVALLPLAEILGGGDKAKGFQLAMMVAIFIGSAMYLWCFFSVKERVKPVNDVKISIVKDLKDALKNDQFPRILLLTLCNVFPGFTRMAAVMYLCTWVLKEDSSFSAMFIAIGIASMMVGSALAKPLTDKFCKLKVFFWVNIIVGIYSIAMYFIDFTNIPLLIVAYIILNILHQIPSPLHWSLMADVDDYGEWKTGNKVTGISFSANLFFLKFGLALAGSLVGFLLSSFGYDASAQTQTADALNGILLLITVIPGCGYLLTALVVKLLKVDRETMVLVQSELAKRRLATS